MNRILKLGQGNPGALTILSQLANASVYIDILEKLDIKSYKIWMLYKDVCGEDIEKTKELLVKLDQDNTFEQLIIRTNEVQSVMKYLNA